MNPSAYYRAVVKLEGEVCSAVLEAENNAEMYEIGKYGACLWDLDGDWDRPMKFEDLPKIIRNRKRE